jgi:DNA-binding transcriptional regulator YdaS (Cro superfamily)
MLDIIRTAADRIGGVPRLAERIGVTRQAIYQWREIPVERIADIAAVTGVSRAELRPDLYALSDDEIAGRLDRLKRATAPERNRLRADRHAWLAAQGKALADNDWSAIDVVKLAALVDELRGREEADVTRRLGVILQRCLKWQYRPQHRSLSTIGVITAERARLLQRFAEAPSLKVLAAERLGAIYSHARAAIGDETGLAGDAFPVDCPYSLDELLDPHFAPRR